MLIILFYPLFLSAGTCILCFRQGRVYPLKFFILEMSLSSKVFLILEIKVSSVLVGRDVYPLFSDREEFIL